MVGGYGIVHKIFSSPLTTLDSFFQLISLARHGKMFSESFGMTDIVSVVTATNHAVRDCN